MNDLAARAPTPAERGATPELEAPATAVEAAEVEGVQAMEVEEREGAATPTGAPLVQPGSLPAAALLGGQSPDPRGSPAGARAQPLLHAACVLPCGPRA
jgi:hypothetical protein